MRVEQFYFIKRLDHRRGIQLGKRGLQIGLLSQSQADCFTMSD
jgi:hypothetical protein